MRILQILQKPQRRGAEIFAAQLAQNLTEKGHDLALVFLFAGTDTLPFKGLRVHLYASSRIRNWDIISWYTLARLIKEFQPDIVQANAGDTLKYAGLSRFFFRWKTPLVFRNANLISGFMDSGIKRLFNRFLLTQVDGVASVSQLCKQDFKSVFGWNKPLFHLPIGTDIPQCKSPLPPDLAKLLLGNPFLIHIGSFVPEKNHEGLLRIFRSLKARFPSLKLVLCADGPLRSLIEDQLSSNVLSLGSRTDIDSILPHAEALLLPSLIEGLPGVILEAMARRVPVVAYNTGGISELIVHGKTGFLIPKGEERMFSDILTENILSNENDLEPIRNAAIDLIKDNYSIEAVSTRFEDFYVHLLNETHKNTHP